MSEIEKIDMSLGTCNCSFLKCAVVTVHVQRLWYVIVIIRYIYNLWTYASEESSLIICYEAANEFQQYCERK